MRWLADENIPSYVISYLRRQGEDVLAIAETSPAISDMEVLALARREQRFLVSFDRDHGDLIFHRGVAPSRGIIFLRFSPPSPESLIPVFSGLISLGEAALDGQFTVISPEGMRQRTLHGAS